MVAGAVLVMLWLLGVQIAYVFGIVTLMLSFVPNPGLLIATVLLIPLLIFDSDEEKQSKVTRSLY